jgi:hypothetical protein
MTDTLIGELINLLLVAVIDAALLSWIALWWYQRSVIAITATRTASPAPAESLSSTPPLPAAVTAGVFPLEAKRGGKTATIDVDPDDVSTSRRRIGVAYTLGALAFAATITAAKFVEEPTLRPAAVIALLWVYAWPVWPALALLLASNRRQGLTLLARYMLAGLGGVALVTLVTQALRGAIDTAAITNVVQSIAILLITASIPLALVALTGIRRVRAVMPLALAATLLFGLGMLLFRRVITMAFNDASIRSAIFAIASWTTTDVAFYILYLLMALPVGWLAWRALRGLAAGYGRKRYSDLQLIVDCWFLIVAMEAIVTQLVIPFGLAGIPIGIVAFVLYRATVAIVLRAWPLPARPVDRASRLLLLRVFGYQARTESLFDQLARRWRFYGPVQLIAGADLAMRTADPGDVLSFVEGRLRDLYVTSTDDIGSRIAGLDMTCDGDGRFRVNEVYCLNNTWKPTLQALLSVTDLVVMDLRNFSQHNSGCRFELEQLVQSVRSDRLVLICDGSTDQLLLRQILDEAMERTGTTRAAPAASLVHVDKGSQPEIRLVMECLLAPGRVAVTAV